MMSCCDFRLVYPRQLFLYPRPIFNSVNMIITTIEKSASSDMSWFKWLLLSVLHVWLMWISWIVLLLLLSSKPWSNG